MKKILLLAGITCFNLHIEAMNLAQSATTSEEFTLLLGAAQDALVVPRHHARLLGVCNLSLSLKQASLNVPVVSKNIGVIIAQHLGRISILDRREDIRTREELKEELKKLGGETLIELLQAADYLDILALPTVVAELALECKPETISAENIASLPSHLSTPMMKRHMAKLAKLSQNNLCAVQYVSGWHGHEKTIHALCVTKDRKIVTGDLAGIIRIWDEQGTLLAECLGHTNEITVLCVTEDNKIVSASRDATLRVWDLAGNQHAVCRGHSDTIRVACVTKDNKIVSGAMDNTIRVWDMEGKQLAQCKDYPRTLHVTEDHKIVSGSWSGIIHIWDMKGTLLAEWPENSPRGNGLVYVSKDNKIVSGTVDRTIKIFDIEGNLLDESEQLGSAIEFLCITDDHKIAVGLCDHGLSTQSRVGMFDMNCRQIGEWISHKGYAFARTAADDKIITSWRTPYYEEGEQIIFDKDGTELARNTGFHYFQEMALLDNDTIICAGSPRVGIAVYSIGSSLAERTLDQDRVVALWEVFQQHSLGRKSAQDSWDDCMEILGEGRTLSSLFRRSARGARDFLYQFMGHSG